MTAVPFGVPLAMLLAFLAGCGQPEPPLTSPGPSGEAGHAKAQTSEAAVEPAATVAEPPNERVGLPIGSEAPPFALRDQHGQSRALADILKAKLTALVFYRSADW
jgi:hypothetical protein